MSSAWASTFHSRRPSPDSVAAAGPAESGWLFQVTPVSVQADVSRSTSSVRPVVAEEEYRRRVAPISLHPGGGSGRVKWTSARKLSPLCDLTLKVASLPKLLSGEP